MPVYLIVLPFIGALIGWVTNWLAIRMLFHPRRPLTILGMRWQGLIPRRHEEIAQKVGDIVADELIGRHVLREAIEGIDVTPALNDTITHLVWDRLAPRLRAFPLFGRMVNDKLIAQIHILVAEELYRQLPTLRTRVGAAAEEHLDLREIVSARVLQFELEQLERIVYSLAARELRQIEWLGAVLGFVIGLLQALFVWIAGS